MTVGLVVGTLERRKVMEACVALAIRAAAVHLEELGTPGVKVSVTTLSLGQPAHLSIDISDMCTYGLVLKVSVLIWPNPFPILKSFL